MNMYRTGILSILFSLLTFIAFSQTWQGNIGRINVYTRQYDPYTRIFTYNESTRKLTWVTGEGDITCEVNIQAVSVKVEPSGTNFYVTFTCNDNSDCIYSSYTGNVKITSITVTKESIANEIVKEIQAIAGGNGPVAAAAAASPPKSSQGTVDRVNELCRQFDPYVRKFSYDAITGRLTWIDNEGEITCSAGVSEIILSVQTNSSDYSVLFTCIKKSKCIDSNYGGPTDETAITITNKSAADEIVQKINILK
jgi:hypothetical protein